MATTYTENLGVPHLGNSVSQPETVENDEKNIFDANASGILTLNFDDGDTLAYTLDDTALDYPQEIHNAIIKITNTGTLITGSVTITVPPTTSPSDVTTFKKQYVINNTTAQNIILDQGGLTVTVEGDSVAQVYCDGLDVILINKPQLDILTIDVSSDTPYTLSTLESLYSIIVVTNTGTANTADVDVTVPVSSDRKYIVHNKWPVAFNVNFKQVTATGVLVPQNGIYSTYCDGTDVWRIT